MIVRTWTWIGLVLIAWLGMIVIERQKGNRCRSVGIEPCLGCVDIWKAWRDQIYIIISRSDYPRTIIILLDRFKINEGFININHGIMSRLIFCIVGKIGYLSSVQIVDRIPLRFIDRIQVLGLQVGVDILHGLNILVTVVKLIWTSKLPNTLWEKHGSDANLGVISRIHFFNNRVISLQNNSLSWS